MAEPETTPVTDQADPSTEPQDVQPDKDQQIASLTQMVSDQNKALEKNQSSIAALEKNKDEVLREKREAKNKAIAAAEENKEFVKVAELRAEENKALQAQLDEYTNIRTENEQLTLKVAEQSAWSMKQVQLQLDAIPENRRDGLIKMPGWDSFTPEVQLAQISHWRTTQPIDQKVPGGIGNGSSIANGKTAEKVNHLLGLGSNSTSLSALQKAHDGK